MASMHNHRNVLRPSQKENQRPNSFKTRGISQAPKRAALGNISNQTRVQPSRAAKSSQDLIKAGQDENEFTQQKTFDVKSKNLPFSIYVDDQPTLPEIVQAAASASCNEIDDIENRVPSLSEAVVRLPNLMRTAGTSTQAFHEHEESPMVLDMSSIEDGNISIELEAAPAVQETDRIAFIQEVPEYAEEIYTYMLQAENKHQPRPDFMRRQQDVNLSMRSILVDWLVEVSEEYKLHRETLFLAVNYIDRFLSVMSVLRGKLQLVGAAAMFLASKYEEIYPPDVSEFVYITDDTYTKKQVLRMEHLMLKVLAFDVAVPTINWFCDRLLRATKADEQTQFMSMYLTELVLIDMDKFLAYSPSLIAAAAQCLANITLDAENPWPEDCQQFSRYSLEDLSECINELHKMHKDAENHPQQAVREKYKNIKFQQVAFMPPPAVLCII